VTQIDKLELHTLERALSGLPVTIDVRVDPGRWVLVPRAIKAHSTDSDRVRLNGLGTPEYRTHAKPKAGHHSDAYRERQPSGPGLHRASHFHRTSRFKSA
jgi:hypothetical protein